MSPLLGCWILMYNRKPVCNKCVAESDQCVDWLIGMSGSSLSVRSNWTAKTSVDSSNLGTVIGLRPARRDFPIWNARWILSSASNTLSYVTAPYAICDASAILYNLAIFKSPKEGRSDASIYQYQEKIGQLALLLLPLFTMRIADWIVPSTFLSAEILRQFPGWEDDWCNEPMWIINRTGQG